MANKAFAAYRAHQAPYVAGLKPFSAEFFAAQKRASADWRAGNRRSNPSGGLGTVLLVGGAIAGGLFLWNKNKTAKAAAVAAATVPPVTTQPNVGV